MADEATRSAFIEIQGRMIQTTGKLKQPVDKQPLLDSGILCCLIHILNALLGSGDTKRSKMTSDHNGLIPGDKDEDNGVTQSQQQEIEGRVVHVMKTLASHPSVAQSLMTPYRYCNTWPSIDRSMLLPN